MSMGIDRAAVRSFLAANARVLDRRRFALVSDNEDVGSATLAALNAYRNPDGGYGNGLEPDLRASESQPVGAYHAFEVLAELATHTFDESRELCDWLASVSLSDGGLPFALPIRDRVGCAPFWAEADTQRASLHITAAVTAYAHRVARTDAAVARHVWLGRSTDYCLEKIAALDEPGHAIELMFCIRFLDAVHDRQEAAPKLLRELGRFIPRTGAVPVAGGRADEMMRPLDFTPHPSDAARSLFDQAVVTADLDRLEAAQQADGGWPLEWDSYSPAAAVEWRGYVTVRSVKILNDNGRG